MKNKYTNVPQINLKQKDFTHIVPEDHSFVLFLEYKKGGVAKEEISDVSSFAIEGEYFRVTNRLSSYRYSYKIKELKHVFILPMESK